RAQQRAGLTTLLLERGEQSDLLSPCDCGPLSDGRC
uniref:Uncharacterized protein n=1 Tax=Aegilops tauschii subsp. strangulata TaxID=200361 RepID=A0A453AMF3_AEGTS